MSTPLGRLLDRLGELARAPATAATERHVLEAAKITPGEAVLVVGPGPDVGQHADSAHHIRHDDESFDVVLGFGDAWCSGDRAAGFAELHRVLRPGGRIVLSAREEQLPAARHHLAAEAAEAGFTDLQTWLWQPPGPLPGLTAHLRALRH